MARKPRVDYPGAWHHVMHRGARREPIFREDAECVLFLDKVGEMVLRHGIEVHAYSLMPNHYHLLVRSPMANLSRAMRHLNGTYTQALNRQHGWDGPVFRGRFQSQLVEDEAHFLHLAPYIHLNPVRAHLVVRPDDDCWTSHRAYLGMDRPPPWLTLDSILEEFGSAKALDDYIRELHQRKAKWPERLDLDTGRMLAAPSGTEEATGRVTPRPPGPASVGGTVRFAEPEAVLARIRAITGATAESLRRRERGPKANPARRFAAWALNRETNLGHREIGELLRMSASAVAKLRARFSTEGGPKERKPIATWIDAWEDGAYMSNGQA